MQEPKGMTELRAKIGGLNSRVTSLQIKHDNLSHRVDGFDEEINEIWEFIKVNKENNKNEK